MSTGARNADDPTPIAEAFEIPSIRFSACPRCKTETARKEGLVCWDCEQKAARHAAGRARAEALSRSIPPDFEWAKFDDPTLRERIQQPHFEAAAKKLVAAFAPRVVLRGASGRGKTSLAIAMLRSWAYRNEGLALFVSATSLSGGRFTLDDDVIRAPLVLLDDVGQERDLKSNALPELVYERHAAGRALWVTTWMSHAGIVERYGDGIARRLLERAHEFDFDTGAIA